MDDTIVPENDHDTTTIQHYLGESGATQVSAVPSAVYKKGTPDQRYTDIKEYLGRPYMLATFVWTGASRGTVSYVQVVDHNLFAGLPYYNRLEGVAGWRAMVRFRVQVAATPFHAGLVRLTWQPQQAQSLQYKAATATQASMLPGVYFDICEQTEAVLDIPWLNRDDYFQYQGGAGSSVVNSMGTFAVTTMCALSVASGVPSPNMSVWISLHDIELIGASPPTTTVTTVS